MRKLGWSVVVVLVCSVLLGCTSGPRSAAGFRLPLTGDIERGEMSFLDLGCNSCHTVTGAEIPPPPEDAELKLALGGALYEVRTDGYLVTSIIHPSHKLGRFPKQYISAEGKSRMPDFSTRMTVRELVDVVAFLQTHYTVKPDPASYGY